MISTDQRLWLERCRNFIRERERIQADAISAREYVTPIRRRAGLGVREFARRLGVSPTTISRVESGKLRPTLELNAKLFEFVLESMAK